MKLVLKLGLVLARGVALCRVPPSGRSESGSASCHNKQPYMAATSVAPLKIPAGLDTPRHDERLAHPAPERAGSAAAQG